MSESILSAAGYAGSATAVGGVNDEDAPADSVAGAGGRASGDGSLNNDGDRTGARSSMSGADGIESDCWSKGDGSSNVTVAAAGSSVEGDTGERAAVSTPGLDAGASGFSREYSPVYHSSSAWILLRRRRNSHTMRPSTSMASRIKTNLQSRGNSPPPMEISVCCCTTMNIAYYGNKLTSFRHDNTNFLAVSRECFIWPSRQYKFFSSLVGGGDPIVETT